MKQAEVLETDGREGERDSRATLDPNPLPDPLRLLTTKELAARLRVSTRTIQTWRDAGKLPHIRATARSFRYSWEQIQRSLAKKQAP